MNIFNALSLIGGLCLFLFGMNLMGDALEKSAGNGLKSILGKLTTGKLTGFFTGLGVTAIIQSSSATTVMVVGFVNSGLMTLRQAINVIMGANVGTTVTAWLLSLSGIEGDSVFVKLLKPQSFTPILALIGIFLYMSSKSHKKKDIGTVLLGFATLMFGMDAMSAAVSGLKDVPEFGNILVMFSNPLLGVLAGAVLTGIIQSSSASVGILQALSSTGQITVGTTIPIIMGQNIGTCVTALLSSVGTNRNARRASIVHLSFNVIGTGVFLTAYWILTSIFDFAVINATANEFTIAVAHSVFNILCTMLLLPASGLLEKLSYIIVKEPKENAKERKVELDERLMATPAVAIEQCRVLSEDMATVSVDALKGALSCLGEFNKAASEQIKEKEAKADHYEDVLGSYLVKLNTFPMSDRDSNESSMLLYVIGDLERISDHAVDILMSLEEMKSKNITFTNDAEAELNVIKNAVEEIVGLTLEAFINNNPSLASKVEPLEQVIDSLKERLRTNHILRMKNGECTIEAGFVWADLLTNLERVSDHCSNIAGCVIEMSHKTLGLHEYLGNVKKDSPQFAEMYHEYLKKYSLNA